MDKSLETPKTSSTEAELQEDSLAEDTGDDKSALPQTATSADPNSEKDTFVKAINALWQDDNDESWAETIDRVQDSLYPGPCESLLERERRKSNIRKRSRQAVLHLTFTEMRITELETELKSLKALIQGLPAEFKLDIKEKKAPVFMNTLKLSKVDEFRLTKWSTEIPYDQRPCLEVLITEEQLPQTSSTESPMPMQPLTRRQTGQMNAGVSVRQTPERLRIRSIILIGHLENICKENLSNYYMLEIKDKKASPLVLLRPFKLLVLYEQAIRDSLGDVEETVRQAENSPQDSSDLKNQGIFWELDFEHKNLEADLRLLIQFMDTGLKPTFDLRQAIEDGTATEIEYADLWHLFISEDIVVEHASKKAQAYRLVNTAGGRDPLIRTLEEEKDRVPPLNGFTLDCCSLCFDGTNYVPRLQTFCIRKYTGRRRIVDLSVYPLRFDPDFEAMHAHFLTQGRQYVELTQLPFAHRTFKGHTLDEHSQTLDAQVIVDVALAINAEPAWRLKTKVNEDDLTKADERETTQPPFCKDGQYREGCCGSDVVFSDLSMMCETNSFQQNGRFLSPRTAEYLDEKDLLLMPNWVHAFVLRVRQWVTIPMAGLSDVSFDNNFDELMFSPAHKKTILALVETHENSRDDSTVGRQSIGSSLDLVSGKGKGLIILLHGEPGVGKTSTAECVADKTKRPLFPVTCGDIGETATEVERNLFHNFRLAHKWGCVMLLDEADVFLSKRNKTDLRRNAVTSVFLRSLEYYAGILFLTTNRVGGIDPAFKSRIHLSLYYPPLDLETSEKLYEVFLRRTKMELEKAGKAPFKIKEKEILRFAKRHFLQLEKQGYNTWNGRQIRNAFQTAIALVEDEVAKQEPGMPKPKLGKAQFKIVAEGSRQFDKYLISTLQGPDNEIAMPRPLAERFAHRPQVHRVGRKKCVQDHGPGCFWLRERRE